jgi:transposase
MKVTHGEAIQALLFAIFQGDHRLYCVNELLAPYDLKVLFGRTDIDSKQFNDTRIGESLDAINDVAKKVLYDLAISGVRLYGKPIKAILGDTTSVSVFGDDYENRVKEDTPFVFPIFGFSKDHRPDLRQIVINLMTTVFGFPVDGDILDGNRSDVETFRDNLEAMATMPWVKDNTPMISDSKLATFPTLARASELKIPIISMIPDTMKIRASLITQISSIEDLPLLLETETGDAYHGLSMNVPYSVEEDGKPNKTIWLRYLVVHSSQLAATKAESRKIAKWKEKRALEKWAGKLAKHQFACRRDALKVQKKEWKQQKAKHHDLTVEIKEVAIPGKRPRGRPAQGDELIPPKIVWKVTCVFTPRPEVASKWDPDGMFVLVTTITDKRVKDDREILEAYRSRNAVETTFQWMKGPLAVAPVFLKTPGRIRGLGFVFVFALQVLALFQKLYREALAKRGVTSPHPGRKRTLKPTTRGVLEVMRFVDFTIYTEDGHRRIAWRGLGPPQMEVLAVLGLEDLYLRKIAAVYGENPGK